MQNPPNTGPITIAPGHASHLGYSVNEINPEYALTPSSSLAPSGGQSYLQVLLQGNYNSTNQQVIEGRFGEGGVLIASNGTAFPRAGRSYLPDQTYPATNPKQDEFDSNFDGMDFYPGFDASGNTQAEQGDLLDSTGRTLLPSERYRRFVTPIDLSGSGRLVPFNSVPASALDFGTGFDAQGRVGHLIYYRPAGLPNWPTDRYDTTMNPPTVAANLNALTPDVSATSLNRLHGYQSMRDPAGANRFPFAAAPSDVVATGQPVPGLKTPTFTGRVNSNDPVYNSATGVVDLTKTLGMYPDGSLALQDAAQMNLYDKTTYDAPLGLGDQEYLDRAGDVDSSALASRLPNLLPDLFVKDANAALKRKLVATETWDTNSWAAPTSSFFNGSTGLYQFGTPNNSTRLTDNSGSILSNNVNQFPSTANLPALMHGGRRLNLNLPLPVSDNPSEPVRQKYVREIYQVMKCALHPPDGGSATAQELAALGQYAVNIVDFRDPDATMTRFINYDITYTDPTATLAVKGELTPTGTAGSTVNIHAPNDVTFPADRTKLNPGTPGTPGGPVVQWGMEYNPIAITEVLAYQYTSKPTATNKPAPTPRMYVELVNTLTKDQHTDTAGNGNGTASDLDLNGWGFIITRDNPTDMTTPDYNAPGGTAVVERPNVATGQLTKKTIDTYFVPLAGAGVGAGALPAPLATKIPALDSAVGNKYYVMGNAAPDMVAEPQADPTGVTAPAPLSTALINQIPLSVYTPPVNKAPPTQSDYFWLHLLRPANPNVPASEKVVVDSFRFPYLVDNGWFDSSNSNNEVLKQTGQNPLYSVRRLQPYRGGHFVPYSDQAGSPYGFTEQTTPAPATKKDATYKGVYNATVNGQATPTQITAPLYHTLGTDDGAENWDYFPFHDRDFQSVAELLLVPACPPGLFTKLFVELPNPRPFGVNASAKIGDLPPASGTDANGTGANPRLKYYYAPPLDKVPAIGLTAPAPPDTNLVPSTPLTSAAPPSSAGYAFNGNGVSNMPDPVVFPYLPEAFFYSTGSKSGWYKFLEFFEVPSNSFGYIGPVAAGQNADWAKQDLRPGLLNLNLIVDEEVFFGLIDDVRLNSTSAFSSPNQMSPVPLAAAYYGNGAYGFSGYTLPDPTAANTNLVGVSGFPRYATAVFANGVPSYSAPAVAITVDNSTNPPTITDRGYPSAPVPPDFPAQRYTPASFMKAAWADFLKLRDGGSGVVYSPFSTSPFAAVWGNPASPIALPSHPYRSLANRSFGAISTLSLDINDTVLRPARLPGFGNLSTRMDQFPTPRIPPRRLFQIPDAVAGIEGTPTSPYTVGTTTTYSRYANSPAGETAVPLFYDTADIATGKHIWTANDHAFLSNPNASLFLNSAPAAAPLIYANGDLGAGTSGANQDHRWHPAFRTEMLSKVMNQTTIRTHQYAVWLTVGFFEVTKEGNKQLYNSYDPNTGASLAVDQLGSELNADAGKNARYRYYFLVDRTKATGFNPEEPGDFRNLIAFRRRIE